MEWHGINLSDSRQQQWLKKSLKSLSFFAISILIACLISTILWIKLADHQQSYDLNQQQIYQLQTELSHIQQKHNSLRSSQPNTTKAAYLTSENLQLFIDYLLKIQVKGIIEVSQLYIENGVKIKLAGKLYQRNQLESLTEQLKQLGYPYKLDYFQANQQNQPTFSLIIQLPEN